MNMIFVSVKRKENQVKYYGCCKNHKDHEIKTENIRTVES